MRKTKAAWLSHSLFLLSLLSPSSSLYRTVTNDVGAIFRDNRKCTLTHLLYITAKHYSTSKGRVSAKTRLIHIKYVFFVGVFMKCWFLGLTGSHAQFFLATYKRWKDFRTGFHQQTPWAEEPVSVSEEKTFGERQHFGLNMQSHFILKYINKT